MKKYKSIIAAVGAAVVSTVSVGGVNAFAAAPIGSGFNDENLYKCVIDAYNQDKEETEKKDYTDVLTDEDLGEINILNCINKNVEDATGISKMGNLVGLSLIQNKISEIDISENEKLESLSLSNNQLDSIDLTKNKKITYLNLSDNNLSELGLSNNEQITSLLLYDNNLSELDLSNNEKIIVLTLHNNNLSELDLSHNIELINLIVDGNEDMEKLDIVKNVKIEYLEADNIEIMANITAAEWSEDGEQLLIDLSGLLFLDNVEVEESDQYKYDAEKKIVIIDDVENMPEYIQTKSGPVAGNHSYKISLANIEIPEDIHVPETGEKENPDTASGNVMIYVAIAGVVVALGICGKKLLDRR